MIELIEGRWRVDGPLWNYFWFDSREEAESFAKWLKDHDARRPAADV